MEEKRAAELRRVAESVFSDKVMTFLALLMIPIVFIQLTISLSPETSLLLELADWMVWFAFLLEFSVRLAVARDRNAFIFKNKLRTIIDLLIVISPLLAAIPTVDPSTQHELFIAPILRLLRTARVMRMFELVRPLGYVARGFVGIRELNNSLFRNRFYHYTAFTFLAAVVASAFLYSAENGINPKIHSYEDALWWAMATISSVGYGDIYPVTTVGRIIAGFFMLVGIGFLSVLTANIAAYFLRDTEKKMEVDIDKRLDRIESMLTDLQKKKAKKKR